MSTQEEERIEAFKKFAGNDFGSADAMELLGSLFFLDSVGKNSNATDDQILSAFREKKPWFSEEDVHKAWSKRKDIERFWN